MTKRTVRVTASRASRSRENFANATTARLDRLTRVLPAARRPERARLTRTIQGHLAIESSTLTPRTHRARAQKDADAQGVWAPDHKPCRPWPEAHLATTWKGDPSGGGEESAEERERPPHCFGLQRLQRTFYWGWIWDGMVREARCLNARGGSVVTYIRAATHDERIRVTGEA